MDDLDAALDRLKRKNVKIVQEITELEPSLGARGATPLSGTPQAVGASDSAPRRQFRWPCSGVTHVHKKIPLFVILLLSFPSPSLLSQTTGRESILEAQTSTRSGVRIHYLESGNHASSSALVLIPGWRLPAYLWNEQLETFRHTTRVIAIDPRSQGPSTKTTEGNTPETRAKDLHEILANLSVSHAVLVGWSQGAQDVASYIQQFGMESLAGVIFVDSPVSIGSAEIERHKEFSKVILASLSNYANDPEAFSARYSNNRIRISTRTSLFGPPCRHRLTLVCACW